MSDRARVSFGIKTTPMRLDYAEILRTWEVADTIPAIEHAWLWDHMLPLADDPAVPVLEGWTLLSALAARTRRLGLGLLVTSNMIRPPAVLAKMAATVDVISGGRLVVGIGVGATDHPRAGQHLAEREYRAYGLPLVPPDEGIGRLAESCTILRRMWAEDVVDVDGRWYRLVGARCEPKPVQRPGPPLLVGGWGRRTLRVVAEHADLWNVPGPPHLPVARLRDRAAVLDEHCTELGRDPGSIVRSVQLIVRPEEVDAAREHVRAVVGLGFTHVVFAPVGPFTDGAAARWLADELIEPLRAELG